MATLTNPLVPLLGPLYGSVYFATVMSTAFYGITCMQTFFYYVHYRNDPLRMKSFVAFLWAINTIHEALTISGAYKYIMAGLANPYSLTMGIPELLLQGLFTGMIAVTTQGYFVYRIYIFSGKNIIAPIIWVMLAITQIVAITVYDAKSLYSANGLNVQVVSVIELGDHSFMSLATICLSIAAGVDVLIAIFLTFLLIRKRRTATGFARTEHILQRLTVFAVNTGIWTALFALVSIILLQLYPQNMLYGVFGIPLCSVYCNTLLANLNARVYVRGESLTQDVDVDLFTPSTSGVSDNTKVEKQRGEVKMLSSAHRGAWKATEVVTFPDSSRSATSAEIA